MANVIRLCHPYNFRAFLEYNGHKFTGYFSSWAIDLIESLTRASNITVQIRSQDDQAGERIEGSTESYSGCIGLLQKNQTDVVLYLTDYPHPAANISQGLMVTETVEQMITAYHPEMDGIKLLQMERSFSSFRPEVWVLCVIALVCSISVLVMKELLNNWVKQMIRVKSSPGPLVKRVPGEVIAHMTNHGQLSSTAGLIRKIMFLVLSFFSFLVIFYLCASIKTDLVVIAPPQTVRSYQELMDTGGGVFFLAGSDHHLSFKFAPQGSIKKKLWDFSVAKYKLKNVLFSYGQSELRTGKMIMKLIVSRKLAFICDSGISLIFMRAYCDLALNMDKFRAAADILNLPKESGNVMPIASKEENARVTRKGFILNGIKTAALKRLEHTLRRALEAGLLDFIIKLVNSFNLAATPLDVYGTGNATTGNMEQCISNVLVMPDSDFEKMSLGNLVNFPLYSYCVITIQMSVLLVEVLVGRCNTCRKKKKKKRVSKARARGTPPEAGTDK